MIVFGGKSSSSKDLLGSKSKYVRLVSQITARIGVHHLKKSAEVVYPVGQYEKQKWVYRRQGA